MCTHSHTHLRAALHDGKGVNNVTHVDTRSIKSSWSLQLEWTAHLIHSSVFQLLFFFPPTYPPITASRQAEAGLNQSLSAVPWQTQIHTNVHTKQQHWLKRHTIWCVSVCAIVRRSSAAWTRVANLSFFNLVFSFLDSIFLSSAVRLATGAGLMSWQPAAPRCAFRNAMSWRKVNDKVEEVKRLHRLQADEFSSTTNWIISLTNSDPQLFLVVVAVVWKIWVAWKTLEPPWLCS